MDYFLVLGSTNAVIDYAKIYVEEESAAQAMRSYAYGEGSYQAGGTLVSFSAEGVTRRALYLMLKVDAAKSKDMLYILVRSVPYLHSTTGARVFYDEQTAKAELDSFNAALSRANFHAYLFTFPTGVNGPI